MTVMQQKIFIAKMLKKRPLNTFALVVSKQDYELFCKNGKLVPIKMEENKMRYRKYLKLAKHAELMYLGSYGEEKNRHVIRSAFLKKK